MAATRNQQPTYDFLTGNDSASQPPQQQQQQQQQHAPPPNPTGPSRLPTASARRASILGPSNPNRQSLSAPGPPVKPSLDNEALRARINTLAYELDTLRQTRAVEGEQLRAEVREAERRAEAEGRRAGEAERRRGAAEGRCDVLAKEGRERETGVENERGVMERRVRAARGEVEALREEVEEGRGLLAAGEREARRREEELAGEVERVEAAREQAEREREGLRGKLDSVQERLGEREARIGELENDVLRLRAQSGDKDTLEIIKKELSAQVGHIRQLEKVNGDQIVELKRLRKERKAIEVVEEEKRVLQGKLGLLDQARTALAEAELKKAILEDEKRAWTSYLETEGQQEGFVFTSPEEMARALVKERTERTSLIEQLGRVQPEITVRDGQIASLEDELAQLKLQVKSIKTNGGAESKAGESKSTARVERQRNLAVKEVEYLRAQLRSLEDETTEFEPEKASEKEASQTAKLEALIDEYKVELRTLHDQLSRAETLQPPAALPPTGSKRPAEDGDDSDSTTQLASLRRKLRNLQTDLSTLEATNATLTTDLRASTSQLAALRSSSRTRVLELRNNPTAAHEATKQSTLVALRAENAALLRTLRASSPAPASVPAASLAAAEQRVADAAAEQARADKKTLRLKQIWGAKAAEFTAAVSSTLGWDVVFMPHGKLRLSSVYYKREPGEDGDDDEENFILFDGERGTMKISGGEKSRFARELRAMVEFWVDGRGEVPLFLAAASLEFWERGQQALAAQQGQ